ncbi:MAG: hypothetical protein ACXABY_10230, partial [Candidatus Thorarchaeota archaeon]
GTNPGVNRPRRVYVGTEVVVGDGTVRISSDDVLIGGSPTTRILSTSVGIDLTSDPTPLPLLTAEPGQTVVVTEVVVRVMAIDTLTGDPTIGIGIAPGEDDIITPTVLGGLTADDDAVRLTPSGPYKVAIGDDGGSAGVDINLGVDAVATATALVVDIDLIGYILQ